MPVLKNPKHERFTQELAKGKSQAAAYKKAGYKPNEGHASRLAGNGKVKERVAELQNKRAERAVVTIESLIQEAHEIQVAAKTAEQFAAATGALTAKAKFAGLWVEKAQTENTNINYAIGNEPATEDEWAAEHVTSH
jgi:phage terminase small subunit